jgi:large subunit ribosomal protein L5
MMTGTDHLSSSSKDSSKESGEESFAFRKAIKIVLQKKEFDLREFYKTTITPQLIKEFGYTQSSHVPAILKISINRGIGKAVTNPTELSSSLNELAKIIGQRPCITKARKSVAGFKVREGMEVGMSATLRREKMYAFLGKLIHINLPTVPDFGGLKHTGFDGRGNYSFGIEEQWIFPELSYGDIRKIHGLNVTIVTSANTDKEGRFLLESFGLPIGNANAL